MMTCMKKMITGHKLCCHMIGAAFGITLGLIASSKLVGSCSASCEMKQIAKKAFKAVESALGI